jgi:hypothetical protein
VLQQQKLGAHSAQADKKNCQDERAHDHRFSAEKIIAGVHLGGEAIGQFEPILAFFHRNGDAFGTKSQTFSVYRCDKTV